MKIQRVVLVALALLIITLAMPMAIAESKLHDVQVKLLTGFGTYSLPGVDVNVYNQSGLIATGYTDYSGSATFTLDGNSTTFMFNPDNTSNNPHGYTGYYAIKPSNYTVETTGNYYQFTVFPTDVQWFPNWGQDAEGEWANLLVGHDADMDYSSNTGKFNVSVYNSGTSTIITNVVCQLYQNNSSPGGQPILINTIGVNSPVTVSIPQFDHQVQAYYANFTISNAGGHAYYCEVTVNGKYISTVNGYKETDTVRRFYPAYMYPGPNVIIPGIPLDWYFWLAAIPCFFIMAAGTVTRKGYIGFIGMVLASIFNLWGWYSLYVPQLVMWAPISFGLVISLVMIFTEREKYA